MMKTAIFPLKVVHQGLLLAVAALLLSGAAQAALTFKDSDGVSLTLESPAQRIVPLAPHLTDMLLALGAGPQIVAAADDHEVRGGNAVTRTGFPIISDSATISYERIQAVKPDLVLAWGEGTPRAWITQLRRQGLPVFVVGTRTLEDLVGQTQLLGQLSGQIEGARQQAIEIQASLNRLSAMDNGGKRLRYFLQIWRQPLYTLHRQHLLSQALSRCGADNIVPVSKTVAPLINAEFVVRENPDAFLLPAEDFVASKEKWQRFPKLQAVKNKRWLAMKDPRLTRPGPDMLKAVLPLCEQLQEWRPVGALQSLKK